MYVEVESFTKKIKGSTVLDDICYSFDRGRVYGLEGKNGSGKTMLLRAISGLIFSTSGLITVAGKQIGKDISFPESMGVLLENPSFIGKLTGRKNLMLLAGITNRIDGGQVDESLCAVGLDPDDKRPYKKYSLGMKQRLGIACATMEKPDLVLLDEPFNALDPSGVEQVKALVKERKESGSSIIIACHDREELEILADEVITLAEGRIINSRPVGVQQ